MSSFPEPRPRRDVASTPGRVLQIGVEASLERVGDVRRQVREHLETLGVGAPAVDSLVLVVDEVISNSIEHGSAYRRNGDRMELEVEVYDNGNLKLRFADRDVPASEVRELVSRVVIDGDTPPPLDWERGRGLFLIATGLDDFSLQALDEATGHGLLLEGVVLGDRKRRL